MPPPPPTAPTKAYPEGISSLSLLTVQRGGQLPDLLDVNASRKDGPLQRHQAVGPGDLDRGESLHFRGFSLSSATSWLRDLGQVTARLWTPASHLSNFSVSLDLQPLLNVSLCIT